MARNQEKAGGLLNRWTTFKSELRSGPQLKKRPRFATDCKSLPEAERFRRQLLGDITTKITEIQNAHLGEHRVRELNDEINKLMRQKHHWELQIIKLGGKNYIAQSRMAFDDDGKQLPGSGSIGSGGYLYFGAAKELPGVRELFQPPPKKAPKRSRAEIYKNIDESYYGLREGDREQEAILKLEEREEREMRDKAIRIYDEQVEKKQKVESKDDGDDSSDGYDTEKSEEKKEAEKEETPEELLERRKRELLAKYAQD